MPLFVDSPARSIMAAIAAAGTAHLVQASIPPPLHAMMQSSVTVMAIAAVIVLTVAHHRSSGRFLTQTQEEIVIIAAFGLFWLAVLLMMNPSFVTPGGRQDETGWAPEVVNSVPVIESARRGGWRQESYGGGVRGRNDWYEYYYE